MRHDGFKAHIEALDGKVDRLLAAPAYQFSTLPRKMCTHGIYLFSEADSHLYVGRSRRIKKRLANHCRASSGHNKASFAFLLARETTGKTEATYKTAGGRKHLMQDPVFADAFRAAKARLRTCSIRFIEEPDPIGQALLEIYAALVLGTTYNDFDTH